MITFVIASLAALVGIQERLDAPEEPSVVARGYQQNQQAVLRALDKITGRATDFEIRVGKPKIYGALRVDLDVCFQTPPEEPPESAAFLRIAPAPARRVETMAIPRDPTMQELEIMEDVPDNAYFAGWMFASSPGLSALEHPVYDIWVITCSARDPETAPPAPPVSE